jgi:hypothetical protein
MAKEYGILLYLAGIYLHCKLGDNSLPFWVGLFYIIQNLALGIMCTKNAIKGSFMQLIINRCGLMYFASAFVFYVYALTTNQLIYFSNCGAAGVVLSWLIVIAVILTSIDYYARRRKH